ncbi:MAG TPA: hypothetical protein VL461_09895 [Dictyobacter sp.]|jgi:hypothetical protein|nr:hypothetical protein [Dictyobacter sp.]
MDAIIGRYRARVEECGLILKHTAGINFDLTPDETLGLFEFIHAYHQTLLTLQEQGDDTETVQRVTGQEPELLQRIRPVQGG